jgi:CheY-like chemotaxis protein
VNLRTAEERVILVVDDDEAVLEAVEDVLRTEGYKVISASCARTALEELRCVPPPDLLLLDLMMPGMDGWTMAARLRDDPRLAPTPLVVMTAGDARMLSRAPVAQGYLSKPLELTQLLGTVARCVREPRSEDTLRVFRRIGGRRISSTNMQVPLVLIVDGTDALVTQLAMVAACGGALARTCSSAVVAEQVAELRPVAVIATTNGYREHGPLLEAAAATAGARLLCVEERGLHDGLDGRIRRAVDESGRF